MLVEKREAFYDLRVANESEKLTIKLFFNSRQPPARSQADSANTCNVCACNTEATLVEGRRQSGRPAMERPRP